MPNENLQIERPPEPSWDTFIAAGLDDFEANITNAFQAIADRPEDYSIHHFPTGFSTSCNHETMNKLRTGFYDPDLFSRYLGLTRQARAVFESFSGAKPEVSMALHNLQTTFPPDFLRRAYAAEAPDGELHNLVRESLDESYNDSFKALNTEIGFLQNVYGLSRPIELLRPTEESDSYRDEVRQLLLTEKGIKWLFYVEINAGRDVGKEEYSTEREQELKRGWMRDVVLTATDIHDPKLADHYAYAASRDSMNGELKAGDIVQKIEALGADKLAKLREFSGNYALADYSLDQLERMALLASGDAGEIARLQAHDVNVVFVNKMGDHNNILSSIPSTFDDPRRRTLFFEIQGLPDIYRAIQALHRLGVAPSTFTLAVHGNIGQLPIVRKPDIDDPKHFMHVATIHARAFVDQANERYGEEQGFHGFSLHSMEGFARMVDKYMQPSKGVDDAYELQGAKTVILDACYAATEVSVKDIDTNTGEPVELEAASIVSQVANDLVNNGVHSKVVLYGADTGIQTRPSSRGFEYTVRTKGTFDRELLGATKIEIDNGRLSSSHVLEVPLRNFDKMS
ncbi:MAG TPA: hypothetical protein VJ836_06825 [Candidatus Saccharimonadales bacterium]|nr:hypothetical protein [Candidatus Saccharimonadales bacterium]